MLVEVITAGGCEMNTSDGRRMVRPGERVTVDDNRGQKLIARGLALAVQPGESSPTVRARYTGSMSETVVEVGSYRNRVPAGKVVDLPAWVVAVLVSESPALWRSEV